MLDLVPAIERLGFDGITLPDHLFLHHAVDGRYPHTPDGKPPFSVDTPWPDPLTLIGALSMVTSSLRFMTGVLILPLRNPVVFAKAAATAARLSNGRVVLGVGVGWMREEFDVLGVDFATRGARTNEMIDLLRTLWQPGPVEYEGRFFSIPPLVMEPVPPPIPIVIGGNSDAALKRAAKRGDGFIMPTQGLAAVPEMLGRVREALAAEDRDPASLDLFVPCLAATADEILEILEPGVTDVVVMPWPHAGKETTSVDEKLEHLERYAAETLPHIQVAVAS